MSDEFAVGLDFRAQLSESEYEKYLKDRNELLSIYRINIHTRTDSDGYVWFSCDTSEQMQKFSAWHFGYFMALGFDEDGKRHK